MDVSRERAMVLTVVFPSQDVQQHGFWSVPESLDDPRESSQEEGTFPENASQDQRVSRFKAPCYPFHGDVRPIPNSGFGGLEFVASTPKLGDDADDDQGCRRLL